MTNPARILILLGLISICFFVITDPRLGLGLHMDGRELGNVIDAANDAWWATLTGVVGSVVIVGIGLWARAKHTT